MATINPAVPQVYMPAGSTGTPLIRRYSAASHVTDGALVTLSSGQISPAGANVASGILGFAIADSAANYGGSIQTPSTLDQWFGFSQVDTPLVPADASLTGVALVDAPAEVEMNLTATTGWVSGGSQQANIGTQIGIAITSGITLADPTASNKVAEIVELVSFPALGASATGVGDLGARVRVRFLASVLA